MKTITLTVKVSIPDNCQIDEPLWLLEEAILNGKGIELKSCYTEEK